jgi:histidinol-phosphatase (PHP family)
MVIDRNLALDVNTAGLRKAAQNLMPDPLILKWYAEMGGERITLGSDAHAASQVGLHLDAALEAVRAVGISHVTQFERRQAHLISL